jgi:hypothetical protein
VGRLIVSRFHHGFRADEWLLYDMHSPAASGGRGFAQGRFYTREGKLIVSTAQEGLIRVRPAPSPTIRSVVESHQNPTQTTTMTTNTSTTSKPTDAAFMPVGIVKDQIKAKL